MTPDRLYYGRATQNKGVNGMEKKKQTARGTVYIPGSRLSVDLACFGGLRWYIFSHLAARLSLYLPTIILYVVITPPEFLCSASTAQHSTAKSTRTAEKRVRADQSATTHASTQCWLEPACRRGFIVLAVFSKRRMKSKSARPDNDSQSTL